MKLDHIISNVGKVPYISQNHGSFLYHFIIQENLNSILELGIAHGTASCYMAGALDELKKGKITSVDLISMKNNFQPSAEEQLNQLKLSSFVNIKRMNTGYTWFLHDDIIKNSSEGQCTPIYDLCIIDGPKNWTIDSSAFFLVDKLLKNNGWIIFDDYNWRYADVDEHRDETDGIQHNSLSESERQTPHIKDIFELLVKQHHNYTNFMVLNNEWAMAQKVIPTAGNSEIDSKKNELKLNEILSLYENNQFSHITYAVNQLVSKKINKVYVYGAGGEIDIMLKKLFHNDIAVIAIIDQDTAKIGKKIQNIQVISLHEITDSDVNSFIINSTTYYQEMRNTIENTYSKKDIKINIFPAP